MRKKTMLPPGQESTAEPDSPPIPLPLPFGPRLPLLAALLRLSFTLSRDALTARLSPLYAAGPVAGVHAWRSR
jgi:hypothetical protein